MAGQEKETGDLQATTSPASRSRVLTLVRVQTDWPAALRESAVIMLSVLAALGAQAWWQGREERGRERDYLRQLLNDTRANEDRLANVLAFNRDAAVAAGRAMGALLDPGPPPPADSFVAWVERAASTTELQPLAGTYRAIVGTGDLRLVRNDSLRALVSDFAATLEAETLRQRDIRDAVMIRAGDVARTMPFFRGAFLQHHYPVEVNLLRARSDQDLIAVLFVMQASLANSNGGLDRLGQQLHRLRTALEAEPALRP